LETNAKSANKSNMIMQVANSKGTEWMVSNYNAWQEQYNQQNLVQNNTSTYFGLAKGFPHRETQLKNAISFAFRFL
jgi:hypothetical protein